MDIAKQMTLEEKLVADCQQMMAQVIESKWCFEVLFEKTFSPVLIHENGRILAINEAVTEQFGYSQKMLIGKQIQTLIDTLTPLPERAKILERIKAGNEQPYHTQCFKLDGTIVAVEIIPQHVSYENCTVDMVILRPFDDASIPLLESDEGNLTPRQQTILRHMTTGLAYKAIAERLHITLPTVHYHRREIFKKLQVNTRVQAVAWAWKKNDLPKKQYLRQSKANSLTRHHWWVQNLTN
ncbi:hypothetical protein MNBD_CHLOROFLEXI01-1108 [hydrothermal vent metagenome]|uniref:HTH luxR-type domain-containing protein n=1 Tax=hydrothermal vent metagenome TaxID=652676 RepID=A0A3B0V2Q3_9ZZZZ